MRSNSARRHRRGATRRPLRATASVAAAADLGSETAGPAGEPGQGCLLTLDGALLNRQSGQQCPCLGQPLPGITPADTAARSATTTRSRLTMALGDGRSGKTSSGRRGRCRASQSMTQAQRALNGDGQGQRLRAATALEQVNDELLALPFESQAQRCRRGLAGTGCRTKNEEQCATGLGGQLQATQRGCLDLGQPDDDGTNAIGSQRAFAGPGGIATGSAGHQQARQIDASRLQCRRIADGRGNADQPGQFVTREPGQRRQQQAQLADAATQPAGVRSGRHAASRHRATRGRARQSPSARRAALPWQAYPRARHRDVRGFAPASGGWRHGQIRLASTVNAVLTSPRRRGSSRQRCLRWPMSARSVSTTIGAKSGFSAISSITAVLLRGNA
jgi:hypothetical protein